MKVTLAGVVLAPHPIDLRATTRNNSENKGRATFKAIMVGARKLFSLNSCGDGGAKVSG
jgi:hypothetical protein